MAIENAIEADVAAVGEARIAFDQGAERGPIEIEGIDEQRALRIADVEDDGLTAVNGRVQVFDDGTAHVHLEDESMLVALEQFERFDARAGGDVDPIAGDS